MLEGLSGFLWKLLWSLVGPAWRWVVQRWQRPAIKLTKAPVNLLDHIGPSSSKDRIQSLLGPPHSVVLQNWFYRFSDVLVQIEFWNESSAKAIALGLAGRKRANKFPVPGYAKPLGELTIADVLENGASLRRRKTLRTDELLVEVRWGPPGAWVHYVFGALMAVGARNLVESYFKWDEEKNCLCTNPAQVLVNWIAITSGFSEEVWFAWSMT